MEKIKIFRSQSNNERFFVEDNDLFWTCMRCGYLYIIGSQWERGDNDFNFCPNCGSEIEWIDWVFCIECIFCVKADELTCIHESNIVSEQFNEVSGFVDTKQLCKQKNRNNDCEFFKEKEEKKGV